MASCSIGTHGPEGSTWRPALRVHACIKTNSPTSLKQQPLAGQPQTPRHHSDLNAPSPLGEPLSNQASTGLPKITQGLSNFFIQKHFKMLKVL